MINYSPELAMKGMPIKRNNLITSPEKPYTIYQGCLYCNDEGYKKLIEYFKKEGVKTWECE